MKTNTKLAFLFLIFAFTLSLATPYVEAADADWTQTTYYVNSYNDYVNQGWTTIGSNPWIGNSVAYIYTSTGQTIGWFEFGDLGIDRFPANMTLQIYAKTDSVGDDMDCYYRFDSSNTSDNYETFPMTITDYIWYNWTFTNFNTTTEFNDFRVAFSKRNHHSNTITIQKVRAVVWHSKATYYIFHGLLSEDTGLYQGSVSVTAFVQGYDPELFTVDGTTIRGFSDRPDYFLFHLGNVTREFHPHTDGRDDEADIYIFNSSTLAYYDVTYYDVADLLSSYPYATTERKINGTWMVVEQHKLNATTEPIQTRFALAYGRHYRFTVKDGKAYIIGEVHAKTDPDLEIVISPYLSQETWNKAFYTYTHVVCITERTSDGCTISISYSDDLEQTLDVQIYIRYMNLSVVPGFPDSPSPDTYQQFNYKWTNADNETNYLVDVVSSHTTFGTIDFKFALDRVYEGRGPISLSILGAYNVQIDMTLLVPTFLLLCVAGSFSSLSVPAGIVATALVFALFCAIKWYNFGVLEAPIIIVALSLAVIAAVAHGRTKWGYWTI